MKQFLPFLLIFQSCLGWGDMFLNVEKITGNYYLVEDESGSYDICYKSDDGYQGRNQSHSKVTAYAYNDTILVMKVQPYNHEVFYYAINMKKDRDFAEQNEYEIGKVAVKDYPNSWLAALNLDFKDVK
jgi:hypothetical protein